MKHNLKITLILVLIFLSAQIVGLTIVNSCIDKERTTEDNLVVCLIPGVERPDLGSGDIQSGSKLIGLLMVAIILGTILLLILIRFKYGKYIWKLWFFGAIAITLYVAFFSLLQTINFSKTSIPISISIFLGVSLAGWRILKPNIYLQNFTELFVYGGLATIFSLIVAFKSWVGLVLLIIISVYDMYSVWKSKHMVKLAKFQSNQKMFAGLWIPYKLPKGLKKVEGKKKNKIKEKLVKVKTAILGGGDIGFPLIFTSVILKELIQAGASFPFLKSLIVTGCVTGALLILLLKSKKDKFYPAMPFITIGCLAGYVIVLLL